jgi:ATP-dependent DNA helicase RecQ
VAKRVDHHAHGALRLTEEARAVLRGERRVEMRQVASGVRRRAAGRAAAALGVPPAREGVLEALKAWRREAARAQGVPAYVIFHDATLAEIARRAPGDLEALGEVPGIGARKLERYGEALLRVVADSARP